MCNCACYDDEDEDEAIYLDRLLRIVMMVMMVMMVTVLGRVGDYLSPPLPTKMPGDQSAQQLTTNFVTLNMTMTKMTNFLPQVVHSEVEVIVDTASLCVKILGR